MKKLIVPFVAAFGLSLGLATGVVVMRAPKTAPLPAVAKQVASARKSDSSTIARDSAISSSATAAAADQAAPNADTAATQAIPAAPNVENSAASPVPTKPGSNPVAAVKQGEPSSALKNSPSVAGPTVPVKLVVKPIPAAARPVSDSLIGRRLAQVFGAMQAKDAARVLEQMDDTDVRAILGSLSSKQQAAILGSFPTQRAASILQATLRTASIGGTE
jgi:MgtE-like protein